MPMVSPLYGRFIATISDISPEAHAATAADT